MIKHSIPPPPKQKNYQILDNIYMYTPTRIPQNPSYYYISPQSQPYRQNRFQYEQQYSVPYSQYSPPQPVNMTPQKSSLPESFQQKLDFLNRKLDQQLKISAEVGARAQSPNIYPKFNGGYPYTNNDINFRSTYTPERFHIFL